MSPTQWGGGTKSPPGYTIVSCGKQNEPWATMFALERARSARWPGTLNTLHSPGPKRECVDVPAPEARNRMILLIPAPCYIISVIHLPAVRPAYSSISIFHFLVSGQAAA